MEGEKSELSMTEEIMLSDETGDGVNSGDIFYPTIFLLQL
jgi:hypothetical protein